jgi:FtsH-binding integral membrane protein
LYQYPQAPAQEAVHGNQNYSADDLESQANPGSGDHKLSSLSQSARLGFVRKVYMLCSAMLLVTTYACFQALNNYYFEYFLLTHPGLAIFTAVAACITMCCIGCSQSLARSVPKNYLALALFTALESYFVAWACTTVGRPMLVYEAFAMTCAVFIALTIYAIYTTQDFSVMGGMLAGVFAILLVAGLFMYVTASRSAQILYSIVASISFCFSIIISTQQIIGDRAHKYKIDDYVMATIDIYVDFIGLFIQLLSLLSNSSRN